MNHKPRSIDTIIDGVRASPSLGKSVVEHILAIKLTSDSGSNAFDFYKGGKVVLDDLTIAAVDYRQPKPGGGATAGPLLNLSVTGKCVTRATLEARYGKLKLTSAPHGHSLDEQAGWSRFEPWGKLTFGFSERNPDCLSSVTFSIGDRG